MSFFTALATSKIAASALAAGALAVGGTGAAAYTGSLPSAVQQSAHDLFGAPAPHVGGVSMTATASATSTGTASAQAEASDSTEASDAGTTEASDTESATASESASASSSASPSSLPVGPDAAGPAAFGLCKAYANGGLDASSTAYKSLVTAANGATNIVTYCASVPAPGQSAQHPAGTDTTVDAAAKAAATPKLSGTPATPELPSKAAGQKLPTQAAQRLADKLTTVGNR